MNNTNFNFYQDGALWIFSKNFDYTHAYVVGSKILYFVWGENKWKEGCVLHGWDSVEGGSDYLDLIESVYLIDHVPVSLSAILARNPEWKKEEVISEFTLQEVAAKLGIPVEQLRIKD